VSFIPPLTPRHLHWLTAGHLHDAAKAPRNARISCICGSDAGRDPAGDSSGALAARSRALVDSDGMSVR